MTKQELLRVMAGWNSCHGETRYVKGHASDDAAIIIGECERVDWLIWLLGRERRLAHFVRRCEEVAATTATAADAAYTANAADAYAAAAAYARVRRHQLNGLRKIGVRWAEGKPAAK